MEYNPISVTELNKYIKNKVDNDEYLNNVLVKGEISNFKHHYTGHMYFTLKDENSLIKCIMFKTYTANLKFVPKDGMKVMILGTVSVFERDGVYQIYCKAMQEDGMGSLYTAYEELKNKLEKQGLFDNKYKKAIPIMPKCIGVLTSNTGSVIRDIINVSTRRNPNCYIKLLPVPVQGKGAGDKIAEAIKIMNENKLADVIILARGGGSLEDLWPFNEEVVAHAIFESELPIISAVGHETELAVPNINDILLELEKYNNRYRNSLKKKIELMRLRYEKCMANRVFKEPRQKINEKYIMIDMKVKEIQNSIINKIKDNRTKMIELITKLDTLSPLKTLSRGYCLGQMNGKVINSSKQLNKDDELVLKFYDGDKNVKVI